MMLTDLALMAGRAIAICGIATLKRNELQRSPDRALL